MLYGVFDLFIYNFVLLLFCFVIENLEVKCGHYVE
jgi:hypothetical protein